MITAKQIGNRGGIRQSVTRPIAFLALWVAATGYGQPPSLAEQTPQSNMASLASDRSSPAVAFGKYLASLQERNPFTEAGPVSVEIEASLPGLAKQGKLLAVREMGASERSEYTITRLDGDSVVQRQVIARYLAAEGQAEALPYSSVAVTPANYKFRYVGAVEINRTTVYLFQITPKKKRNGLLCGEIWIDSQTGIAIRQAGHFVKRPSVFIRHIEVARETNLRDGSPHTRATHLVIDTRLVGRAELTIIERPVQTADSIVAQQITAPGGGR
jgi:hypothetical protein